MNETMPPSVQQLLNKWNEDSKIDMDDLSKELARVYQLQIDYLTLYNVERFRLKSIEMEERKLKLAKFNHYAYGPTPETKEWVYPPVGKILRQDVGMWTDADKDLQTTEFQKEVVKAKLDTLQAILDSIKYRGTTIKSLIQREIWQSGG